MRAVIAFDRVLANATHLMPQFSTLSRQRLETCDQRLQDILNEAIRFHDFTVICGHRSQAEQDEAVRLGRSKLRFPMSKHNSFPSMAVDVAPYFPGVGLDWQDREAFARLFGFIERIGIEQDVQLRWGGDWDRDRRTSDEGFQDLPHIELFEH